MSPYLLLDKLTQYIRWSAKGIVCPFSSIVNPTINTVNGFSSVCLCVCVSSTCINVYLVRLVSSRPYGQRKGEIKGVSRGQRIHPRRSQYTNPFLGGGGLLLVAFSA